MKTYFILLLIFTGYTYGSDERIVGGYDANVRVRHQVSLQNSAGQHMCGGSLINSNWILTAAHCVRANLVMVGYGSNTLAGLLKCNLDPNKNIIHKSNTGNPFYNFDIGLVKSTCRLNSNANVGYATFPAADAAVGSSLIITGWGLLSSPGSIPNKLQQLTTKTISSSDCKSRLGIEIPNSVMCTLTKVNEGVCMGDSGSGLVNSLTTPQIYGIVSGSVPCARGYPDLFVRVMDPPIISWIANTVLVN